MGIPSLVEILDDLHDEGGGPSISSEAPSKVIKTTSTEDKLATLKSMPEDEKAQALLDWKFRGFSVQDMAKGLGVHATTVYRLINKAREEARKRLESTLGADLIVDSLMLYERMEEACLFEITQLENGEAEVDKKGRIRRGNNLEGRELRLKFIGQVAKIRQTRDQMLGQVGVMPKAPERIYHTMSEENRSDEGESGKEPATRNEMLARIEQLLKEGRSIGE